MVKAFGITEIPDIGQVSKKIERISLTHPEPKPDQVVVKVHASNINIDDVLLAQQTSVGRLGGPKPSEEKPYVPGMDVSGTVIRVGNNVKKVQVGDEIVGMIFPSSRICGWAQETLVQEKFAYRKPKDISFEEAVTFVNGTTAYVAFRGANLQPKDKAIVIGASGGIGNIITQLLTQKGIYTVGVCSTKNIERVKSLGANFVIDYTKNTLDDYYRENDIDAVFDCVGGVDIEQSSLKILKTDGSFITLVGPEKHIGFQRLSQMQQIKMFAYMIWRSTTSRVRGPKYQNVYTSPNRIPKAVEYFQNHDIHPSIDRIVQFEENEIKKAIDHVYSRHTRGKVVIKVI